MAKNFIQKAIKRPGREKRAAAKAGMSTHAYMEKEASNPKASRSEKAAANLGLRLEKMHGGETKPMRYGGLKKA